jgi:hypothetical protein
MLLLNLMDNQQNPQNIIERLDLIEQKIDKQAETVSRLYRLQKISTYSRYAYWLFLILATFGAFYFLQPALGTLGNIYGGNGDVLNLLDNVPDATNIQNFKAQSGLFKNSQ